MINFNDKVVFSVRITWADVRECMTEHERNLFDKLPEDMQLNIINNVSHSLEKGLEGGLMTDWTYVMRVAMSNVDFFDSCYGTVVHIKDSNYDGTLDSFDYETGHVGVSLLFAPCTKEEAGVLLTVDRIEFYKDGV